MMGDTYIYIYITYATGNNNITDVVLIKGATLVRTKRPLDSKTNSDLCPDVKIFLGTTRGKWWFRGRFRRFTFAYREFAATQTALLFTAAAAAMKGHR